ncbi:MAG: hypothetical protein JWN16_2607 [Alphaproteobacteria bacterium]|nr:hypothetical protein [Alphaproteobacteria bacterium]
MAEERPGVVERAFQIAKSGTVASVADLSAQLEDEGYPNNAHLLKARSIAYQLSRMITESRMSISAPVDN